MRVIAKTDEGDKTGDNKHIFKATIFKKDEETRTVKMQKNMIEYSICVCLVMRGYSIPQ
jgi:hypothetical protein